MVAFGLFCASAGLWLWNGLGPHFGLKEARDKVDSAAAVFTLALLMATVIAELLTSAQ